MRTILATGRAVPLAGWRREQHVAPRHLAPVSLLKVLALVHRLRVVGCVTVHRLLPVVAGPLDAHAGQARALGEAPQACKQVNRIHLSDRA